MADSENKKEKKMKKKEENAEKKSREMEYKNNNKDKNVRNSADLIRVSPMEDTYAEIEDINLIAGDKEKARADANLNTFCNPVFQADDEAVEKLKAKREEEDGKEADDKITISPDLYSSLDKIGNLKTKTTKKVSWNDTVAYNARDQTDVVIDGLHDDDESVTDPVIRDSFLTNPSPILVRRPNGGSEDTYQPDLQEEERQQKRKLEDDYLDPDKKRPAVRKIHRTPTGLHPKGHYDKTKGYKYSLCVAVVLLSISLVGLVVLGTVYGVEFRLLDGSNTKQLRLESLLKLENNGDEGVFINASKSTDNSPGGTGVTYYLLNPGSSMPWQQPLSPSGCKIAWFEGDPISIIGIHIETRTPQTLILGNPLMLSDAHFVLTLDKSTWWAARVLDDKNFALVSVICQQESAWRQGIAPDLISNFPLLRNKIEEFARP